MPNLKGGTCDSNLDRVPSSDPENQMRLSSQTNVELIFEYGVVSSGKIFHHHKKNKENEHTKEI